MANACQIVELWECECFLAIFGVPFRIGGMAAVLEFDQITKEYRSFSGRRSIHALDSFTVQVEAGEIFGFLGPNGAGKSTAIHLAMGFMRPTSGQGRMLGAPFGHSHTRRRVGFLAENVALYHRPAEKLIRFYGALNGMDGAHLAKRTRNVLQIVGLQEHVRRNIGKFSRGMLQRAGLAQALVNDPELLILDEPTSALDPLARVMVRELLLGARSNGKTIFLSSHLLSEVELVCDRVAVLHRGTLVRLGRTADLPRERDDLLFIFKQIAIYVIAFSVFFGASAIYNERRSRRILGVLSKAVARDQYLAGLILGVTLACAIYCFALGVTATWTLGGAGFPISQVWFLMLCLVAACVLAGTVALMFSTFLHPFLAAGAAALVLGLPALAGLAISVRWAYIVPVFILGTAVLKSNFKSPGGLFWFPVGLAFLETFFFWALATVIFSRVDIAVEVE